MSDVSSPRPVPADPAPSAPARPRRVALAAVLTGLEGLAIAVSGLLVLVLAVVGEPDGVTQAVTGGVTLLLLAAVPLAAGVGLWRLRRWSRGPAVATQILALPTAWHMNAIGGSWSVTAGLLAAVALVVLVALASPAVADALGILKSPSATDADGPDGDRPDSDAADGQDTPPDGAGRRDG